MSRKDTVPSAVHPSCARPRHPSQRAGGDPSAPCTGPVGARKQKTLKTTRFRREDTQDPPDGYSPFLSAGPETAKPYPDVPFTKSRTAALPLFRESETGNRKPSASHENPDSHRKNTRGRPRTCRRRPLIGIHRAAVGTILPVGARDAGTRQPPARRPSALVELTVRTAVRRADSRLRRPCR